MTNPTFSQIKAQVAAIRQKVPQARVNPVLVIVIDGMSVAVCRELLSDLTRHEWMAICEPGRNFNRPAVATLPSVTEFSRTSLLCGRLQGGAANDERAGFAEHPALLARCRTGSPPLLFHRATLQETEDAVLTADVRHEIGSAHRKIVGVIVNAVDDHLLKGGQIDTRWSRDEIKVLPALLHEARTARRLVVLLADHGHVLDCQTRYVEKGTGPFCRNGPEGASHKMDLSPFQLDGGERWRAASGEPAADELLVQGQRVLVEGHRLIAPWSERVRYGSMKNGYHGGLSPQEMVVPIAVLSSIDSLPAGWHEQPVDTPAWWDEPASVVAAPQQPAPVLKPKQLQPGALFDLQGEEPTQTVVKAEETPPE